MNRVTETDPVDLKWIATVPRDISESEVLAELRMYSPDSQFRIETLADGRVRIWQGRQKMTVRPSLREALGRARWWYCDTNHLNKPLAENARIVKGSLE